jgi:serine/threonine protein kinase
LIDGKLVYESKFAQNCPTHKDVYNIQILRSMDDVPGFSKLVGVVVDNSGEHLRSYLIEFPQDKWDFLSDVVTESSEIPWERRESWARQLVEAVRQLHFKLCVIGNLWRYHSSIIVDSHDRLHLWSFEKKFDLNSTRSCWCPPEFDQLQDLSSVTYQTEFSNITPKTDIFHLGMALWYLANGYPTPHLEQGSSEATRSLSTPFELGVLQHVDGYIALPRLPDCIPRYYRDIIDECRSVNPHDRPAAWRILERFPPENETMNPQIEDSSLDKMDLSSMKKRFIRHVWCDYCRFGCRGVSFHCNICSKGDFDICLNCYKKGEHCSEANHLLLEMEWIETKGWTVSQRYHTVVKVSGKRDIVEL